jgi:hypothetical protein
MAVNPLAWREPTESVESIATQFHPKRSSPSSTSQLTQSHIVAHDTRREGDTPHPLALLIFPDVERRTAPSAAADCRGCAVRF